MNRLALWLHVCLVLGIHPEVLGKSEFSKGFEHGYVTGYKKAAGTKINPIVPLCPLQPLKTFGDPDSDYEQGYLIGLEQGIENGDY
jgi:hypothetical protein